MILIQRTIAIGIMTLAMAMPSHAKTWLVPDVTPLSTALISLQNGDVISIQNGITINEKLSIATKSNIIIHSRNLSGINPVVEYSGTEAVYLGNCNNVQLENVNIRAGGSIGINIQGCSGVTIVGCDITKTTGTYSGYGVHIYSASNVVLNSLSITNFEYGIYNHNGSTTVNQGNGLRRGFINARVGVFTFGGVVNNHDFNTLNEAIQSQHIGSNISVVGNSFERCVSGNILVIIPSNGEIGYFWENKLPEICAEAWSWNNSYPNWYRVNNAPYGYKQTCNSRYGLCTPPQPFISNPINKKYSILIAYDLSAKETLHKSQIFSEIDRLNNIYKKNNIPIEALLVKTIEIPVVQPITTVDFPSASFTGAARDEYKADLVVLLVNDQQSLHGGYAFTKDPFTNQTRTNPTEAMVNVKYFPARLSLAHEIGHLFGLADVTYCDHSNGTPIMCTRIISEGSGERADIFLSDEKKGHLQKIDPIRDYMVIPATAMNNKIYNTAEYSYIRASRTVTLTPGFAVHQGTKVRVGISDENGL